jgi:hypothetical protein
LAANLTDAHQVIFGVLFILIVLLFPGGLVDIFGRVRNLIWRRAKRGREEDGPDAGEANPGD